MRILSLIAVVMFVSSLAAPARAGMAEDCDQDRDLKRLISGCTAVIRSGQWQGKDLAKAYFNRGNAYRQLGEYSRAIEDYDRRCGSIRLDPGHAKAYNNRGSAYFTLGEYHRAIEDFDQALRLDPNFVFAYNNRGNAYLYLGEHRRAIEDFDQALRLDPGDAAAYNNRGIAYRKLGEHARAIEDYDQALRLDPGLAQAYIGRANAHCELGMIEASLDDRMQTLRLRVLTAKDAQRHLRGRGFYKGAIDGDFGPASQKALHDWTAAGCPSG